MARGVVHLALRAAVIAIGWLVGAFVTSWAPRPPPTVVATTAAVGCRQPAFFFFFFTVVAAQGLCPGVGLALPLCHLDDWGVLGTTLYSLGALVHQAEERRDILDVVGHEVLQHLLIPCSLAKCNYHRSIGDTTNGIVNLGEPLDEGA
jgi:hypothetical protein